MNDAAREGRCENMVGLEECLGPEEKVQILGGERNGTMVARGSGRITLPGK